MRNLTRNAKSTNQNYLDAHEDPSDEEVEMQQDDNIDASSSSSVTKKTRKGKGKAVEQDSSDMEEQVQVKTVDKGKGKAVAQDAGDNDDDDDGSADEKEDSEKAAAEQEKLKAEIAAREKDNIEEHRRGELEVFLAMPIDILAEVCSHLPPPTLLALCRTNKMFRRLLLSSSSRSIWITSRANAGFPKLEYLDLTEIQYAVLLHGRNVCWNCERYASPDFDLCYSICGVCQRSIVLSDKKTKKEHKGLHKDTFLCTPSTSYGVYRRRAWWGPSRYEKRYLVHESLEQSRELFAREEADKRETEDRVVLQMRASGGRTRRASKAVSDDVDLSKPHTERVKTYVEGRKTLVEKHREECKSVQSAYNSYSRHVQLEMYAAQQRERERVVAEAKRLKENMLESGWTESEYGLYLKFKFSLAAPTTQPLEDVEGWNKYKEHIVAAKAAQVARETAEKARREAEQAAAEARRRQSARRTQVVEKHEKLLDAQDDNPSARATFPRVNTFLEFASVKPFWESEPQPDPAPLPVEASEDSDIEFIDLEKEDDSPMDVDKQPTPPKRPSDLFDSDSDSDSPYQQPRVVYGGGRAKKRQAVVQVELGGFNNGKWKANIARVIEEVEQYREKVRIETIKTILVATTGTKLEKLSDDPEDYDEQEYDENFFNRFTSHFVVTQRKSDSTFSWERETLFLPYPSALAAEPTASQPPALEMNARGVRALKAILKLANIKEKDATVEKLDKALPQLRWLESTTGRGATAEWNWKDLIPQVARRGLKSQSRPLTIVKVGLSQDSPPVPSTSSPVAAAPVVAAPSRSSRKRRRSARARSESEDESE